MNVQRRCEPLTDEEWKSIDDPESDLKLMEWNGMQDVDFKRDNFGTYYGVPVLLDYGELT